MIGNNFLDIMLHQRFTGHQSYVLLCTETTLSNPPVLHFWSEISKIVKSWNNLNSFHLHIGKINKNYDRKYFFGYHDALKIYRAPKLCSVMY